MEIETARTEETQETALSDPDARETAITLIEAGCTGPEIRAWLQAHMRKEAN
jgi:hypothetical protein